jgi:methyltransferase (TIGR00027 family)
VANDAAAQLPDGVSMTALGVAWIRALESERADRLFEDPLAARFVAASDWSPPDLAAGPVDDTTRTLLVLAQSVIVRTRFLDDLLASAWASGGGRQVVILGAGLDTRAFRLPWPRGSRCFELDLAPVLAFKAEVLTGAGAAPACERVTIPADLLADNWPRLLVDAGFRPGEPAVWIAEGLLIYFSQTENDALLDQIGTLSRPGHRLAITSSRPDRPLRPRTAPAATGTRLLHDPDSVIALWRWKGPSDAAAWLAGHGWEAGVYDREERAVAYGRPLAVAEDPRAATRTLLIDAVFLGGSAAPARPPAGPSEHGAPPHAGRGR